MKQLYAGIELHSNNSTLESSIKKILGFTRRACLTNVMESWQNESPFCLSC